MTGIISVNLKKIKAKTRINALVNTLYREEKTHNIMMMAIELLTLERQRTMYSCWIAQKIMTLSARIGSKE